MKKVPVHLDEADLLSLIEGQPVGHARAIREAIEADPEFGRDLAAMRLDRAALCSLADAAAPVDLLAGVEARLERAAMADLVGAEPAETTLPVSSMVITHPGVLRQLLGSRSARRFALAAGLLMTGGVIAAYIASAVDSAKSHLGDGALTGSGEGNGASVAVLPGDASRGEGVTVENGLALGAPVGEEGGFGPGFDPMLDPLGLAAGGRAGHGTGMVSTFEESPAFAALSGEGVAAQGMTLARAMELAGEGRLVIRLRSTRPEAAEEEIRSLTYRSSREVTWRPLGAAPEIVTAMAAMTPRPAAIGPSKARPDEMTASENGRPVPAIPTPAAMKVSAPELVFVPLYAVEFDASPATLQALLRALEKTRLVEADLVELDAPVELAPSLEPGPMLWWGRRPAEMVRRRIAPIVLETRVESPG